MYPKLKKSFGTKNCLYEGNIFQPTSCESEHEPSKSSFPVSDRDLRRETRFGRSGTRREISGRALLLPFRFSPVFFRFFPLQRLKLTFVIKRVAAFRADSSILAAAAVFFVWQRCNGRRVSFVRWPKKTDKYFVAGENRRETSPEKFRKKSGMKVGRRRRSW